MLSIGARTCVCWGAQGWRCDGSRQAVRRDDGHRWVSWCLGWCRSGCACTFPRKERGGQDRRNTRVGWNDGNSQRPGSRSGPTTTELQFVRAGQACWGEAAGASRWAAGLWQSTQQACQCKKAANARCWVCAAAARQLKADLWAGATIDMTNRGWIAARRRSRS